MLKITQNTVTEPLYDKHHKVSSLVKSHQNTQLCQIWSNMKMSNNPGKYEVLIKRYLRSIQDTSEWSLK